MSFSRRVKEELIRLPLRPGPENRAEVTALLLGSGRLEINKKGLGLTWEGEIAQIARRLYMMLKEEQPGWTIQIQVSSQIQVGGDSRYRLLLEPGEKVGGFLKELGLVNEDNIPSAGLPWTNIKQETSRRAFLRGYFLARGSISNPESGYYMELLCDREELARDLTVLGDFFDLSLHIRRRRQFWLVYQNRVSEILTFLNVIGAHSTLLDLESNRIVKEMRSSVNRKVNWETANLEKTIQAGLEQLEDIRLIASERGLSNLPPALQDIARLRLRYPHLSLKELGEKLSPPLGKSGVNHRLRRLGRIAKEIRKERE